METNFAITRTVYIKISRNASRAKIFRESFVREAESKHP